MKMRLFAWVSVKSATGKSRRRRVSVRKKAVSAEDLALRFVSNVSHFITDPTIKSMTVDVRIPPDETEPELMEMVEDEGRDIGEADFAWRHESSVTNEVVGILQRHYPDVVITAGHVGD